jgi:hypothetical protein
VDITGVVAKIRSGVDSNSGRRCFVEEQTTGGFYKCTVMIPLQEYEDQSQEVKDATASLVKQGKHYQLYRISELELEGRAIQGFY